MSQAPERLRESGDAVKRWCRVLILCLFLGGLGCSAHRAVDFHLHTFASPVAGEHISSPIESRAPMNRAVLSWNTRTPDDSAFLFAIRASTGEGVWSPWFDLGRWGTGIQSESAPKHKNRFGSVDIDTLLLNMPASHWQYRVTPQKGRGGQTPKLHAVALALKNSRRYRKWNTSPYRKVDPLPVPALSQFEDGERQDDPEFKEKICSPASGAMLLQHLSDQKPNLFSFARLAYDHRTEIYGNWPFNTAALFDSLAAADTSVATRHVSYVRFFVSLDDLLEFVERDAPAIVSIKYKEGEIKGAPLPTEGHLLLVRGADKKFIYVNDPAAPTRQSVPRKYKRSEFQKAWKGVAYITQKWPADSPSESNPPLPRTDNPKQ